MNTIELTVLVEAQKAIDVALREFASGKPLTMATATPLAKSSGALEYYIKRELAPIKCQIAS